MVENHSPSLTHKRVLQIAIPVVLSNATVPILGAVDTGVVGQMGAAVPIGAVGIGAIIITSIYWIFGFLRMGTAGMTAQAVGAEDKGETVALLIRALIIGVCAGLFLIMLQIPIFWGAFKIAPASAEVEQLAQEYLQIRVFSAPFAIALYGVTGWLIAQERTREVLVLQLWMNGLNIILDMWFVLSLGWGVTGVAIATVIAETTGAALGLWMVRDAFRGGDWNRWDRIFDKVKLWKMAVVNSDILIRSVFVQAGFTSFMFFGSAFDDVTLAANQVLIQFLFITSYALDGFAFASEALVGQALGAANRQKFRRAVVLNFQWGVFSVILYAIAFWVFGEAIIGLMTTSTSVQESAAQYLPWMILAPLVGVASWMFDGVFIGATRTRDMRNMMVLSFAIYMGAIWILMPAFGNHGLWASLMVFFIARGVTLGWKYPALERSV